MRAYAQQAVQPDASRNGQTSAKPLQESLDTAFPYLERIGMVAKKNPYAMLTIIVSIASVVIIAITTLSVSVIGSVFIMYGKMNTIEAKQETIIQRLDKQDNEDKLTRTYNATVLSRQNYMVGLMDGKQQQKMTEYDK